MFRPGPPELLRGALLAVPTQHAVHRKLYGIGGQALDDDAVADFYARLLLAGMRADRPAESTAAAAPGAAVARPAGSSPPAADTR